jgi:hypothetical protein
LVHYNTRYDRPPLDRVTHLVFVDGRLVESWREPADGTEWEAIAHRHDRESLPPEPPPKPIHEQVLEWLAEICGGPAAVDALTGAPLTDDAIDLPVEYAERTGREQMEATAELLDTVAARWFDTESSFAFRHALLALWSEDPETVTGAATAAHLAGGICWAVGKANGLYNPAGTLRVGRVQEALALRSPISGYGGTVRAALRGFRGRPMDRWGRPVGVPDLLALSRTDVLLGDTRGRLVRIRERARAAAADTRPRGTPRPPAA